MPIGVPSVLVIGGGLTGAAVSRALRRALPAESVTVWEAMGTVGGRMHTERASVLGVTGLADTGAQYVTVTDDSEVAAAHKPLYDALVEGGILRPMTGRIEGKRAADGGGTNYVAPLGVASIVEHLFAQSALEPVCSHRAQSLRCHAAADANTRGKWEVASADGRSSWYDGVVLTTPIAEMSALLDSGEGQAWLAGAEAAGSGVGAAELAAVQYSSRYALTLFFPPAAAAAFASHIDWTARYVGKEEDDAIVYLCHDSAKRGDAGGAPSLVVHSSVPYGLQRLRSGAADAEVEAELLAKVQKLLPWLPEPARAVLRPWRVSQVRFPLSLKQGAACLKLCPPAAAFDATRSGAPTGFAEGGLARGPLPALVLAGDAFSPLGSRFDGCVQSGEQAAAALLEALEAP